MAELIRLNVAEAIATRDYPIILRDGRTLVSEQTLNLILGALIAIVVIVDLLAAFWFETTRLERHGIEIAGIVFGAGAFMVMKEMRREHVIEVSASGLRLKPHSASAPIDIAWRKIIAITEESGDVILTRSGEVPWRQALLSDVFGFRDLDQPHFGVSAEETCALLEAHRVANSAT